MAGKTYTRDWTPDEVRAVIEVTGNDGHTVFYASAFPERVRARFARTLRSDRSSYKETIFGNDGEIIDKAEDSIYGLDVLECMARDLRVEFRSAMGRGFRARNITDSLRKWLEEQANVGA